ncbi:MAG: 3-isopropylmalate dehydratase small subunit [Kiritimatiellae bacterium]|jgi:3-isopropylmalate/(R)-2-methylmalate dehydratase small subunit|nr:3-isopropylmalate dehydratase small subunit [Kiritimatiellia bacterium]
MRKFEGKVLFLDRSDINTDEIIPAKYLTEIEKSALGPHLLEDLNLEGFSTDSDEFKQSSVAITRANFGCGSSREHAPWAFAECGYHTIIASGFARIFRQNMFNGGLLAIELTEADIEKIFNKYSSCQDVTVAVDMDSSTLTVSADDQKSTFEFVISGFDRALVEAGGWLEYADENYD